MRDLFRITTPFRLRTQIAVSLTAAIVLTVAFGYSGLTVVGLVTERMLTRELSPAARRAMSALDAGRAPPASDLNALTAEAAALNARSEQIMDGSLLVLTVLAAVAGVAGGGALARRFSEPLDSLAEAARRVAAGDFSARARPRRRGAGETAQLLEDFNLMAASLERAESRMKASSAAIAHELRTPLTVLRGRLQGMRDGVFPAGDREFDHLIGHVEGLSRIVDDLQTVSTADAGVLRLQTGRLDLAEAADAVVMTVAPDLSASGVAIELDLRPAPTVADASRVRQALLALLENVRVHASEGGSVRVETRWSAQGAVLRVLDRGPGFVADAPDEPFEPFWRADASRSRDSGGAGLGLAVVDAVMRAHGGRASIASRPGGGGVVELRFPTPDA